MTFPVAKEVTPQVTPQVENLINILNKPMNRQEIQDLLQISDREYFRSSYLKPAIESGLIEMTIPNKPNSPLQKYTLTELGINLKNNL